MTARTQPAPMSHVSNGFWPPFTNRLGVRRPSAALHKQLKHALARNRRLAKSRKVIRQERDFLKGYLYDAEVGISDLEADQGESEEINRAKNTLIARLQQEKSDLRYRLHKAWSENDELQDNVRAAQATVLRSLESGRPIPMEDRDVCDKLLTLEERLRRWARTYALDDITALNLTSDDDINQVISGLEGYCIQEDWSKLQCHFPVLKKKLPYMLSQATLAKAIFERAFTTPFFIFPDSGHCANLPGHGKMDILYKILTGCDGPGSQEWRSHMLLMLNNGRGDQITAPHVDTGLQNFAASLAKQILNGPIRILLKPPSTQAHSDRRADELRSLVYAAGELAFRLWTQRIYITVGSLDSLKTYSAPETVVSPHPLHLLDDDNKLETSSLGILTQPLILAWGDEEGEHYDTYKVWSKAVVCVDETALRPPGDLNCVS
ncbi:hypothetical protein BDW74DRAFT_182975 [Aspergillus multicolor]|uniref:uncharacterized protein n=1 Tax=Aspergillus multicolor TaxID=41759 RepID=UPI003CCE4965